MLDHVWGQTHDAVVVTSRANLSLEAMGLRPLGADSSEVAVYTLTLLVRVLLTLVLLGAMYYFVARPLGALRKRKSDNAIGAYRDICATIHDKHD